jgi:hypothetical protein
LPSGLACPFPKQVCHFDFQKKLFFCVVSFLRFSISQVGGQSNAVRFFPAEFPTALKTRPNEKEKNYVEQE